MSTVVNVFDLASGVNLVFVGISPREAVIAAYAQSVGDMNTWDYEKRYGDRVVDGHATVLCGDFSALKAGGGR